LPSGLVPQIAGDPRGNFDWQLTLEAALAIAMQNSSVVRVLEGGQVAVDPVTGYDPAIAGEATKAAMGAFDVTFGANFYYNRINQPPDSFFGPGIPDEGRRDEAAFTSGLSKLWSTGTETRITYNPPTGYLYYPYEIEGFNPTHVANLEFLVRQPLLRGMGVEVNRAPIIVAQLKTDQSGWEFKRAMLEFVRSVEEAYWQLQAARAALAVIDAQLPLIEEVVRLEQAALESERSVPADVAKARAQLHAFRQRQIGAQAAVLEKELRLRNLLGLEPHDKRNIIPTSAPSRGMMLIDPMATMQAALDNRPDLLQRRLGVRIRELEAAVARNGRLPQFDAYALYRMNGVAEELGEALDMMAGNHYHDWQFGVAFSVPLGRTTSTANLRAAQLRLEKEHAMLHATVHAAAHQLSDCICRVNSLYQEYAEAESRVRESRVWLQGSRVRYENPPPARGADNWLLVALDDYLLAMRSTADAEVEASDLLARFNVEVARLEEAKGTLLASAEIRIANDPCLSLPTRRLPAVQFEQSLLGRGSAPPPPTSVGPSPRWVPTPTTLPSPPAGSPSPEIISEPQGWSFPRTVPQLDTL